MAQNKFITFFIYEPCPFRTWSTTDLHNFLLYIALSNILLLPYLPALFSPPILVSSDRRCLYRFLLLSVYYVSVTFSLYFFLIIFQKYQIYESWKMILAIQRRFHYDITSYAWHNIKQGITFLSIAENTIKYLCLYVAHPF